MGKWGKNTHKRSPLYRAGNKRKLLKHLQISGKRAEHILNNQSEYYYEKTEEINGKVREIQLPIRNLRRLHERVKVLLERIKTRECVMSPRRAVTIRDNGLKHAGNSSCRSFDIRQFYPSTTEDHVFYFFLQRMGMTGDLARFMAKLLTYQGRVAFGSPLSPILCAHVHEDLYGEFERIAGQRSLSVSAWVDDVVVSGNGVPAGAIFEMRKAVAAKGLRSHKLSRQSMRRGAKITGTVVRRGQVRPANKMHLKIRDGLRALRDSADRGEGLRLLESLIGRHNHCLQVYEKSSAAYQRVLRRKQWLCEERRELNSSGAPYGTG